LQTVGFQGSVWVLVTTFGGGVDELLDVPDPDEPVPPEPEAPELTETKVEPTMKIRLFPESDGSETSCVWPEIDDASCFAAGSLPGAYSISLVV
jgi:hypothetical protein